MDYGIAQLLIAIAVRNQLAFPAYLRIIGAHSAAPFAWSLRERVNMPRHSIKKRHAVAHIAAVVLLVATLAARAVVATTFMSVEPIPGGDVVGEATLAGSRAQGTRTSSCGAIGC
jgi:hypothetical protein